MSQRNQKQRIPKVSSARHDFLQSYLKGQSTFAEYYDTISPKMRISSFWLPDLSENDLMKALSSDQSRFINPPTGSAESKYQSYFIGQCAKILEKSCRPDRSIIDTSATAYLDGRKPDCTLYGAKFDSGSPLVPMLALSTIEIKPVTSVTGSFTATALGEALTFGARLLYIKSFIPEVTCAVTDCHRIQFFRIQRSGEFSCTSVEKLGVEGSRPSVGLQHLCALLTATASDLKAELPALGAVQLDDHLGAGTYGVVFAGRLDHSHEAQSVAVKVFTASDSCIRERDILQGPPRPSCCLKVH